MQQEIKNDWIPDICFYHNVVLNFACPDGLAGAWVIRRKFLAANPNLIFIGITYEEAKDIQNFYDARFFDKKIIVVDFSFSSEVLEILKNQGCSIRTIDHHKSYLKQILDSKTYNLLTLGKSFSDSVIYNKPDKTYYFNSSESGATLTWKLLFPKEPVPEWLKIIRQNDIFIFEDELAEHIHYGFAKLKRSFELFDNIHEQDWFYTRLYLADLGKPSVDKKLIQFEKIINNKKKFQIHSEIPLVILNQSEMVLKSRLAKYVNEKFKSLFTVIVNKDFTRIRIKGDMDLLTLFADYKAVGHEPACSFDWNPENGLEVIKEMIDRKLKLIEVG